MPQVKKLGGNMNDFQVVTSVFVLCYRDASCVATVFPISP